MIPAIPVAVAAVICLWPRNTGKDELPAQKANVSKPAPKPKAIAAAPAPKTNVDDGAFASLRVLYPTHGVFLDFDIGVSEKTYGISNSLVVSINVVSPEGKLESTYEHQFSRSANSIGTRITGGETFPVGPGKHRAYVTYCVGGEHEYVDKRTYKHINCIKGREVTSVEFTK